MARIYSLFILALIGIVLPISAQNKRGEKKIATIERKFLNKEKFAKAVKKAKKLDKKVTKAGNRPSLEYSLATLYNKVYLANGNALKANTYFLKSDSLFEARYTDSTSEEELTNHASVLLANARFNKATLLLQKSVRSNLSYLVLLHQALGAQGEFEKSANMEPAMKGEIAQTLTTIRSLKKQERRAFWRNVGQFNLQVGQRLAEQGNYDSAMSLLIYNRKAIVNHVVDNAEMMADYYLTLGRCSMELGDMERAEKYFDNALDAYLEDHKIITQKGIEILSNCLQTYYALGKDRKLDDQIKKHFIGLEYYRREKTSLNTIPLLIAELERKTGDGDFKEADKTAQALLALGKNFQTVAQPQVLKLYNSLYGFFISRDNFADAAVCLEVISSMAPVIYGDDSPALALQNLQVAQFKINYQFDKSTVSTFTNPSIWGKYSGNYGKRHAKYLPFINSKAQAYALGDQLNEQVSSLEEGVNTALEIYGQTAPWARQLVVLAEAELNRGNFPPVPTYINQAIPVLERKEGKNSLSYLTASRVLAEYYENTGKLDDARSIYRKTFRKLNRLSRRTGVNSFSQPEKMAQVYLLTGDYATAQKQLDQAIEQKTRLYGDRAKIVLIEPLVLLAKLNFFKGNYITAQQNAQKAIDLGKELGIDNSLKIQQANKLQADVDFAIGDYKMARTRLEKILTIQEKTLGASNPMVAGTLLKLSLASYYSQSDIQVNKDRVDRAASIFSTSLGNNSLQLADAMIYQAMFSMELNQLDSALATLAVAKTIYNNQLRSGNIEEARILRLEGDAYVKKNEFVTAETRFKQSADIYRNLFGKSHPEYLKTQSKLARLKCKQGLYSQALVITQTLTTNYQVFVEDVFPFLTEREKAKYWNQLKQDFDLYYGLVAEVSPNDQKALRKVLNSRINTKALLLRSSVQFQKDVRNANKEDVTALFDKWLGVKRQLAASYGLSAAELAEAGIDMADLQTDADYLEKSLRRKLYGSAEQKTSDQLPAIYAKLGKNKMLVETIRYNSVSNPAEAEYAFLLADPATKKLTYVISKNGSEMERGLYKYYQNAVKLGAIDKYSYPNFWEDLDEKIPDGKVVYFSPDGVYSLMNPETFVDAEGKYVIEKNNLEIVNNPGDVLKGSSTATLITSAELVGNPKFYRTAPRGRVVVKDLPATGLELIAIKNLMANKGITTEMRTQDFATEDSVKHLNHPGVLHFATHGYFNQNEDAVVSSGSLSEEETGMHPLLQSGLLLTNAGTAIDTEGGNQYAREGIFTAFEAKDLDLSNTDLVVLSACETGLGRVSVGEGVFGLQRAFLDAGTNSIMMSLFKVNDEATKELMESFYKNWLETGNKHTALASAKMEMKEKYKDTVLWGSFILIGN